MVEFRLAFLHSNSNRHEEEVSLWEARYAEAIEELKSSNSCNVALLKMVLGINRSQVCAVNESLMAAYLTPE